MPFRLPTYCLNEIFEHFVDTPTLHSCILVNRHWCKISVRILWKSIWNYNTLIACLPNESKEFLHQNEIIISTPTLKPPLFNYISFIKRLSIKEIDGNIEKLLKNHQTITSRNLKHDKYVVTREVFKMFMNKISLKGLNLYSTSTRY